MKNTAKRENQICDNLTCRYWFDSAMGELNPLFRMNKYGKRLRTCEAYVFETDNFYILRSYGIFVACIDKRTKCGHDVLQHEYGYTATSAQHISKFLHDYGAENYRRYYPVK